MKKAIFLACGALLWAACSKNSNNSTSTTSVSNTSLAAQGDASADAMFNDVTANVMTAKVNGEALGSVDDTSSSFRQAIAKGQMAGVTTFGGGDTTKGTITISLTPETPGVWPKTLTINFGTGFTDLWGNTYSGSISMVFTGRLDTAGNSVTTTFNNYTVNSIGISGTHIITNTSASGTISYKVQIEDAKVTVGTNWVTWSATHTWTLTQGASTPRWPFDDVYSVTGSGGGITSTNFTWTSTIETPLTKAYVCPWFEAGTIKVVTNYGTGILDYGSGTCDNQATITVGDSTRTITLGR
ncbi:hypothetical protein [Dinghuibacter silviterrae]|uniref:Lipoprotein n=1 Tax=Dinghuibacter silviterrae TaxID=1539049 RepID=A0A4V3GLF9_9BACT|nr:hypothetical protein [Dinghuibacter silviterrae]TDW99362.1 hypothetical protein EDB95_0371 [Dinghuibacter silviterrae]